MDQTTGQSINNYILQKKLGEGGMGDVYLARHSKVERTVAIKILHQNLFTNETIRTRFKNEANALIKLAHPNIIKIYDYVEQETIACLIMEYFDGITLDDYINKLTGPIPSTKAVRIFSQVLDAVQYAHDRSILHRDIKPGNIMVSRDGNQVRIMDFGIAKLQDAVNLNITHANIQLGTPFYMSPEQVKGLPYSVQSDIYSLGVTLFEMVTGKCPYSGITNLFELQSKIVSEQLPSTEAYYPNVPVKVQEAIKTATNKNSSQRFTTCVEFKKYLEEEKKGIMPVTTKQAQQVIQKEKPATKKKSYAWVWVFIVALVAIGGMAYSILKTKSPQPLPPPLPDTTIRKNTSVDITDSNITTSAPDTTTIKFTDSVAIPQTLPKVVKPPTVEEIVKDAKSKAINIPINAKWNDYQKGRYYYAIAMFNLENTTIKVSAKYKKVESQFVFMNVKDETIDTRTTTNDKVNRPDKKQVGLSSNHDTAATKSDPCKKFPYPTDEAIIHDVKQKISKAVTSINAVINISVKGHPDSDGDCNISIPVEVNINGRISKGTAYYILGSNGYKISIYK